MANHEKDGKFDRPKSFLYHPYELFFCGFSNSGKTTLLAKVVEHLSSTYKIGCVKHCSHNFDFDKEGKDSWKLSHSGAEAVLLTAPGRWAIHHQSELNKFDRQEIFKDFDFVLAEGAKEQAGDKILVIDEEGEILEKFAAAEIQNVVAFVGVNNPQINNLPFFHRDDVEGVAKFVDGYLKAKTPAIKALILTGGRSSRMGEDKAKLCYHDEPQLQHLYKLLKNSFAAVHLSCRNSEDYPGFPNEVYLADRLRGFGPLGGIISAMAEDAKAAWLVVAVDLPFIDAAALNYLLAKRNPFKIATAFKSEVEEFPEPLFAIYEPQARGDIFKFLSLGYSCPRKVLNNSNVELLEQVNPLWLKNVNTPEEFKEICQVLKK